MSDLNPFLTNMPLVTVVTSVRAGAGGEEVESNPNRAFRVWARVRGHQSAGAIVPHLDKGDGPRVKPEQIGVNSLAPY